MGNPREPSQPASGLAPSADAHPDAPNPARTANLGLLPTHGRDTEDTKKPRKTLCFTGFSMMDDTELESVTSTMSTWLVVCPESQKATLFTVFYHSMSSRILSKWVLFLREKGRERGIMRAVFCDGQFAIRTAVGRSETNFPVIIWKAISTCAVRGYGIVSSRAADLE